jgi:hypothetical protein
VSLFACLDQPGPESSDLMLSAGTFDVAAALMLIAVTIAALFAPLVRRAYRNRVQRLMGLNQVRPRPDAWWQARSNRAESPEGEAEPVTGEAPMANCLHQERRITRATVAAWLAFTLSAPAMSAWSNPATNWVSNLEFAILAGLLALGPALVNLPQRWRRNSLYVGIGALLLMLIVLGILEPDILESAADNGEDDWPLWVMIPLVVFIVWVYLALVRPRIRGQVIPLALVSCVFSLAFILPIGYVEPHLGSCLTAADGATSATQGQPVKAGTIGLIAATLAMLGLWVAFRALGLLASGIERGWLGDLSMVSLVGLAVVASTMVFVNAPDKPALVPPGTGWLPLLWVAVPVAIYMLFLGRRPPQGPGLPLLMLRVFSKDKRKQTLLRDIQERWRFVGAVDQAGGPDMVDLNVDPYECSKFMTGSLHELFLPEAVSGERLMARFEHAPDREGRYRINEMFNFNTSWRGNVEQLILNSPTILLDVRGLTAEREGTSFEIGLLARHALLDRVVAVGDGETDWDHIGERLREYGQRLDDLRRADVAEDPGLDRLFGELIQVATRGA